MAKMTIEGRAKVTRYVMAELKSMGCLELWLFKEDKEVR
jgi:hypothetical protein